MKLVTEVSRFLMVASVPTALMLVFPYRAVGFKAEPSPRSGRPGHCRFVELTAEEEAGALNAARSAWSTDAGDLRRIRLELMGSELPEPELGELLECSFRVGEKPPSRFMPDLLPATRGADAPHKLPPAPESQPQPAAFPREELLKID